MPVQTGWPWEAPGGRLGEMVQAKRRQAQRTIPRPEAAQLGPQMPAMTATKDAGTGQEGTAAQVAATMTLSQALQEAAARGRVPVIAEVKRRSPSAGIICNEADALAKARRYAAGGAAALSVLADPLFFGGGPEDVTRVAAGVDRPVLFKDIVVIPEQIEQAVQCGARAVLLIAAALGPAALQELLEAARRAGIEPLVEVHSAPELEGVLPLLGTGGVVGINNRDLATFTVHPSRAIELLPRVPEGICCVAESGYHDPEQVADVIRAGADGVLIGEALMRSGDPEGFLQAVGRALQRAGTPRRVRRRAG